MLLFFQWISEKRCFRLTLFAFLPDSLSSLKRLPILQFFVVTLRRQKEKKKKSRTYYRLYVILLFTESTQKYMNLKMPFHFIMPFCEYFLLLRAIFLKFNSLRAIKVPFHFRMLRTIFPKFNFLRKALFPLLPSSKSSSNCVWRYAKIINFSITIY